MTRLSSLVVLFALVCLLAGCGGGSGSGSDPTRSETGSVTFAVLWPQPSRLIPAASKSIKIELFDGATRIAAQTITNPATKATFSNLPIDNIAAKATAYPADPDAAGNAGIVPQATGTVLFSAHPGDNGSISLTLSSTIDHIDVTSGSVVLNGPTTTLSAAPKDAAGNLVLVAPGALVWSTSDPAIATVDPATGAVTGTGFGTAIISVTDRESKKVGSAPVKVLTDVGTAIVTVINPPPGTRSLRVDAASGGITLATRIVAWTTGNSLPVTINNLSPGAITVTATAFSQDQASGGALGAASGPATIQSKGTANLTLNLVSRVDHLGLSPANPTIFVGSATTLTVSAFDKANGKIADLLGGALTWQSANSGIAKVDANGTVTGVSVNTTTITATDPRTAMAAKTDVAVIPTTTSATGSVQ